MDRFLILSYGFICYIIFLITFLYSIGFVGNILVPKSIDIGPTSSIPESIITNLFLLSIFAIQHSVMARPAFKRWWITIIPETIERSTYVLLSSVALLLMFWLWKPITLEVWTIDDPSFQKLFAGVFWTGWIIVLSSTFMISHTDLFGLRQTYLYKKRKDYTTQLFKTPLLYKFVRHPIMLGFVIAFWATSTMTFGHLLFSILTTCYILVALQFEEHDLVDAYGSKYKQYQDNVPMILPFSIRKIMRTKK